MHKYYVVYIYIDVNKDTLKIGHTVNMTNLGLIKQPIVFVCLVPTSKLPIIKREILKYKHWPLDEQVNNLIPLIADFAKDLINEQTKKLLGAI